jgi:hypothetical protein
MAKKAEGALEQKMWKAFKYEGGQGSAKYKAAKKRWGREPYLGWRHSDTLGMSLKMAWRVGAACLGYKMKRRNEEWWAYTEPGAQRGGTCRWCGKVTRNEETEYHIAFDIRCDTVDGALGRARRALWEKVDRASGGERWRRTSRSKEKVVSDLLTGEKGGTKKDRKDIDRALRKFLVKVETILRKQAGQTMLANPWEKQKKREDWEEEEDWIALDELAEWMEKDRKKAEG